MEIGQSGVTDVAITAKPGFALWSKAGVTIELSDGLKWEEGEEKGGGGQIISLVGGGEGASPNLYHSPPIPGGKYVFVFIWPTAWENHFLV